jgi:hypothetical protein
MKKKKQKNRYTQIIETIFLGHYKPGNTEVSFDRAEIATVAQDLGIQLPKNLGDVIYSFRYRTKLPEAIHKKAPREHEWLIRPAGRGKYKFVAVQMAIVVPSEMLAETKIPDATPGVIDRYALNDEQALLAKIRYNRLIDIFTGIACYSLQNHLRTTVSGIGQVETDEIYIGIDKRGAHYILPVQAKGESDKIGIVQIEQDFAVCAEKFPNLICRPIAAQVKGADFIAMFEFELTKTGIAIVCEKHYRLVSTDDLSPEELEAYRNRPA